MLRSATPVLTDHARFWVVRPRLSAGSISGLETLVSGSYIEIDPGLPGGQPQRDFTGLANPPGVRSDEPGRTFNLLAERLGSLGPGSPVFYRDVAVGEVLGYETPGTNGPITVHVFIRKPFDEYVHRGHAFLERLGAVGERRLAGAACRTAEHPGGALGRGRVRHPARRVQGAARARRRHLHALFRSGGGAGGGVERAHPVRDLFHQLGEWARRRRAGADVRHPGRHGGQHAAHVLAGRRGAGAGRLRRAAAAGLPAQ